MESTQRKSQQMCSYCLKCNNNNNNNVNNNGDNNNSHCGIGWELDIILENARASSVNHRLYKINTSDGDDVTVVIIEPKKIKFETFSSVVLDLTSPFCCRQTVTSRA